MIFDATLSYILLACIFLGVIIPQLYVSYQLYKYEKSILWGVTGLFLWFGLNIYVYQIVKLEKHGGLSFEKLNEQQRETWRVLYLCVMLQYLVLFTIFGWLTSPSNGYFNN